jgi:hypothetical protein
VAISSQGFRAKGYLNENGGYSADMARAITRPDLRKYVVVSPHNRSVSSFYFSAKAADRMPFVTTRSDCSRDTAVPYQRESGEEIAGYDTIKYSRQEPPGKGRDGLTVSFWYAPALDCFPLREKAEWINGQGQIVAIHDKIAIRVVKGEPGAEWFEIPVDYQEMAPSAAGEDALGRSARQSLPESLEKSWDFQDRVYVRSQAHKP